MSKHIKTTKVHALKGLVEFKIPNDDRVFSRLVTGDDFDQMRDDAKDFLERKIKAVDGEPTILVVGEGWKIETQVYADVY